jgi:hypothetical protein
MKRLLLKEDDMKIKCEVKEYIFGKRYSYWELEKIDNAIMATHYNDDPNYPIRYFDAIFENKNFNQVKKIIKEYGESVIDNITEDGYWIEKQG